MKLRLLLKDLPVERVVGSKDIEVTGLSADSRTVAPGNLFVAKRGANFDGTQFVGQAVENGAVAVVTDIYDPFLEVTQVICKGEVEAGLAARYYGEPSKELFVVGVTGTKGKTTTSYLVKHLLDGLGWKCGLVGTVETVVGESRFRSSLTTHDAIANQKLLREMVKKGCRAAVLEVSSHGLEQGRVDEIDFQVAIFTNLYPDHLDYHETMEAYAAAKKKLFDRVKQRAIVNGEWGSYMVGNCGAPVWVVGKDLRDEVRTGLIGRFNVANAMCAVGVGLHLGAPIEKIREILGTFENVPGRLERVESERGPRVFVDFAHTGEALENVLKALKEIAVGKVVVVFGCGGNRDPGRRAGMGRAAEALADRVIVTSDNPRKEDPEEICRQILVEAKRAVVELDRKKAIYRAIAEADESDIVLIAGKGHEKIQIFAHQTIPFDDVEIAKEALQNLRNSAILPNS